MDIKKDENRIIVHSYIDFDDKEGFCGMPYISLVAHKEDVKYGWKPYEIGIAIHDKDDFDIGLIYRADEEHFFMVLHELINWMRDHEQGISLYEELLNPFEFFPDCGCERRYW